VELVGHKKRIPEGILNDCCLEGCNYLTTAAVSTTAVVSTATAVVSATTAAESVDVASVEALPPQATNVVAIANTKSTFFILFVFIYV
jgi:hypothetical protein